MGALYTDPCITLCLALVSQGVMMLHNVGSSLTQELLAQRLPFVGDAKQRRLKNSMVTGI